MGKGNYYICISFDHQLYIFILIIHIKLVLYSILVRISNIFIVSNFHIDGETGFSER